MVLGSLIAVVAPLLFLGAIFKLLRRKPRIGRFNSNRAQTRVCSLAGRNAAAVLAVLNLAVLATGLAAHAERWPQIAGALSAVLPAALVIGLIALVVLGPSTDTVLAMVGVGAAMLDVGLQYGAAGVIGVAVIAVLLLFLLGVFRGFVRPAL